MRKISTAALAIATATSVAIAGTAVAGAQTAEAPAAGTQTETSPNPISAIAPEGENGNTASSLTKTVGSLEFDKEVTGEALFGSSTGAWGSGKHTFEYDLTGQNATDRQSIPVWAQVVYFGALAGLAGLVVTAVANAANFAVPAGAGFQLPSFQLPGFQLPAAGGNAGAAATAPAATGSSIGWHTVELQVPHINWN